MRVGSRRIHVRLRHAVLAATGVAAAAAASAEERQWYAGAAVESASITVLRGNDVFSGDWDFGPSSSGYGVHGGLRLLKHLAVEGGVQRIRNVSWTEDVTAIPGVAGFYTSQVAFDAALDQVLVVGLLPFARIWEGYVKGGVGHYRFDGEQTLTALTGGPSPTRPVSKHGTSFPITFGVSVALAPSWRLAIEVSSITVDESFLGIPGGNSASLGGWLIGADYRFGRKSSDSVAAR